MQQFVIPQFIGVEDKIIGPITTRQFVILLSAAIVLFILYKLTTFTFFLIFGFPTFAIGIVLAFIKINGQPFHFFLLNLLQTSRRPNLRVWNKELTSGELLGNLKKEEIKAVIKRPIKDVLEETKLSELSLIVNTGGAYRGEEY